ncbi:MAG: hypothetical protein ACUVX9_15845 [Anaerolineae bacterium]
MKGTRWIELIGALALIAAGILFLLNTLGVIPNLQPLLWAVLLGLAGVIFLAVFFSDRRQWWALIPSSALVGVSGAIGLGSIGSGALAGATIFVCLALGFLGVYLVQSKENWWALIPASAMAVLTLLVLLGEEAGYLGGAVLFVGLGLAFVVLYSLEIAGKRHNWWALIPAGALLSLALVVILSGMGAGDLAGSALFFGLGVTFGVLYLLRSPERPLDWAWIPSVALLAFAAFVLLASGGVWYARYILPVALIVIGVVLMLIYFLRHGKAARQ